MSRRDLDLTFGVNAIAVAACYKEFVPAMVRRNHGHVVTMASQSEHRLPECPFPSPLSFCANHASPAAYVPVAGMVDYAASKSACLALHEGLQTELKHLYAAPAVRCTVVCPSVVATDMFAGLGGTTSSFFSPTLRPERVADEVVRAVWAAEARHVEMPWLGEKVVVPTRTAPSWWRVLLQDGGRDSMAHFSGHKVLE